MTAATIKTPSPATAVDFSPVNAVQLYASRSYISKESGLIALPRRKLAVGLEDGVIQIFSNTPADLTSWKLDTTIDTRCAYITCFVFRTCSFKLFLSLAHVSQIHRLSWRPAPRDDKGAKELASCSEDGTLKILIIQGQ